MAENFDERFALAEVADLRQQAMQYFESIAATERFSVAGAAAVAAFSVSGATPSLEVAKPLVTAIPFIILSLAALRCLTIYLVLRATLGHIRQIEEARLADPCLGFQRRFASHSQRLGRDIAVVSAIFWLLACGAAAAFWYFTNGLA